MVEDRSDGSPGALKDYLSIAFLTHVASSRAPTGAERILAILASGMQRRGHRVAVAAPAGWCLESELLHAGVEVEHLSARACWLTYYEPRPWPVAALKWMRWASPQTAEGRISRWLRRWNADVVHVNCLPQIRGARAARAAGKPTIWHLHEILPPGRRRRWLAGKVTESATRVVAVSEAVGRWVAEEGLADRTRVVHNGVVIPAQVEDGAAARRGLGLPEDGVLFGLFGQVTPHKGALSFVEAGRRALVANDELRFVVGGAGPEPFRRQVRQAMEATGRSDRFHLLEPQPGSDRLNAAADVVCLTTITPDPLPCAVMEAMASARPVAAFDSGGTSEMVRNGETGLLVPTGNVGELADAFVRLARDSAARVEMGRAGQRRAREVFSIARQLDALEGLYRGVAS